MRLRLVLLLSAAGSLVACTQASDPTPKTDEDKAAYALGVVLAKRADLKSFDLTDAELALARAGFADGVRDKSKLDDEAIDKLMPKLQELHETRGAAISKREKESGSAYLAKAATESGAKKLDSGVIYKVLKEGTGAQPQASDTVKAHYEGKFVDGKVFDSSLKKDPVEFPLSGVIPCWSQGVQQMKVGGKAQIVCPPETAYGDQAQPPMRAGATLVFEVELLDIVKPAAAPAAPELPAGHPATTPKK